MRHDSQIPRRRRLVQGALAIGLAVMVGLFVCAGLQASEGHSPADQTGSVGQSLLVWLLPVIMIGAVTANQLIQRQEGVRCCYPVAASTTIYEGTMFFINGAGYATDGTGTGANRFGGIAIAKADNAAGAAGDVKVEGYRRGIFELVGSGFAQSDVGRVSYATDNFTLTTTYAAAAIRVGIIVEYVSSTKVRVAIDDGVTDGLEYAALAASAALTASSTETAFDKAHTIPANSLRPGDVIRVRAQGIATATNSTDTLDAQLRLGTTDILATGAVDVANNDVFFIDADIVIRTIGATGTMVAAGHTAIGAPGTVTSKPKILASTTIDTTADISVNVSGTWSTTSGGNSCRLDILNVEIIRKR